MTRSSHVRRIGIAGICRGVLGVLVLATCSLAVHAQDYPSRPIRLVVPYSAGGASDAPMRVIAQELSKQMGQQVIIDNKPGQGAMLGSEAVARSAPDGYTLGLGSNPQVISPSLYPRITFDPIEDFAPISLFGREPSVLVVHPSFPATNLKEFVAYVKERPGAIDYASSGNGSAQHLFTAMFLSRAELQMVHVPYRGSAQATTDLVGGQVKFAIPGLAAMMSHIREGRLRPLAVTGKERSPLLPDVPTVDESGFTGFSAYVWNGLLAPKGTPQPVLDKLHRELLTALEAPAVKSFMTTAAMETITTTPTEFQAFMRDEKERAAKVVKDINLRLD
jgi:tripartite-type tricarboxylate transporter receptor subunit TctC